MDLRKRAAESILSAMVELPRSGSGSEVAALERLIADVESGPARRDVRNADPSAQEDTVARAKQHDQAVLALQRQVQTLTQRVERRDEAIRDLHRRLAVEAAQVHRGTELSRQEARLRIREQEQDEALVSVALRERIAELERAVQVRGEELEEVRRRTGADHVRFKAQVERNEQQAFDFNERLRGLEHERKSSVVILAAKDRIIERSQQEMLALEEKLFNERKRLEKLLLDNKRVEELHDKELQEERSRRAGAEQSAEELATLQVKHAALSEQCEALMAENLETSSKYAELWRRLDSGSAPVPLRPPGSPSRPGATLSSLLAPSAEASDEDEDVVEKAKIIGSFQKSPVQLSRKHAGKAPGKARSMSRVVVKPSDLILRHNSVMTEGGNEESQFDYGGVNLARIGLSKAPDGGQSDSEESSPSRAAGQYTKSILGVRRNRGRPEITVKAEKAIEETAAGPEMNPRPRSAIGSFARQWAASGKDVALVADMTSTSSRLESTAVVRSSVKCGEDRFPGPEDELLEAPMPRRPDSSARRKNSRKPSTCSASIHKTSKDAEVSPGEPQIKPAESEITNDSKVPVKPSFMNTRLTVKTNALYANTPKQSDDSELHGKIHALQTGLAHKQHQLEEEQKVFTTQIVKLKAANDSLTGQVADLEQRLVVEHRELSHERDELSRTVKYLSEQLANAFVGTGIPQGADSVHMPSFSQKAISLLSGSFNWDSPASSVPDIVPPRPRGQSRDLATEETDSRLSTFPMTLHNTTQTYRPSQPERAPLLEVEVPVGRRRGKVGAAEIFLPTFVEVLMTPEPDAEPPVELNLPNHLKGVMNEPSSSDIKIPENEFDNDTPANPRTVSGKIISDEQETVSVLPKPVLVDAAVGDDPVIVLYEDKWCQFDLDEARDVCDPLPITVEAVEATPHILLPAATPASPPHSNLVLLSEVLRSLEVMCKEMADVQKNRGQEALADFIDAGIKLKQDIMEKLPSDSDCEKAGSVKAVIQCLDIVFIYLRSLLASKAYLDNPGGDEKTQRQIFQPIDPSASKPFFYRGTSFSAPVDPSCRQVDGHLVSSPKVDKNLLLNDSDSYDIQDVYNFAQSIDGHKILNRRESPHHEEGNEHFSNLMSVQEGFIDSSGSCEVRILFPVVRPLVATPSRKESTRPVPHLPAERNRVSSGSPAAATLMAGFSTILFGEPEPLSKNSVLLGKQAFEPASPIGLPSNYAPAAPMAPRSVSSITSPRPKSAVAEVRKASSYKLDPTTQCTEDAVMGEACVGDQPQTRAVTAPEKRVAFSLDEGSNIDSRNIDEDLLDDSDAMFIYQQLMADFDEHISSTSSKVHSPEVHALGSRRASTNMYKDGRGAFQPTITDISDRNDRKSSNKDGTMKNYILKDNNLQNIRKSSMF